MGAIHFIKNPPIYKHMIVNPLTKKNIKADGKLAQKLLKMHQDKQVKLKRGDIKIIKECKQHGGGGDGMDPPTTNKAEDGSGICPYLSPDMISQILGEADITTAAHCLRVFKPTGSSTNDAKTIYKKKLKEIDEIKTIKDKLAALKKHFGNVPITKYKSQQRLTRDVLKIKVDNVLYTMFKKLIIVPYTSDFTEKEDDFRGTYAIPIADDKENYQNSELYKGKPLTVKSIKNVDDYMDLNTIDAFNEFRIEFEETWILAIFNAIIVDPTVLEDMFKMIFKRHHQYKGETYDDDNTDKVKIENLNLEEFIILTINTNTYINDTMSKIIKIITTSIDQSNKYDNISISELIDFLRNINIIHKINAGWF